MKGHNPRLQRQQNKSSYLLQSVATTSASGLEQLLVGCDRRQQLHSAPLESLSTLATGFYLVSSPSAAAITSSIEA